MVPVAASPAGGAVSLQSTNRLAARAARFKSLYAFQGQPDGANPEASLLDVGGTLYGTTYRGGASNNGTVFKIMPSGKESVLYSFKHSPDGGGPEGGLILLNGALYGTTIGGGANGDGTVFKVTLPGKETVLHSFGSASDGFDPEAGLIEVDGILYGTTDAGGANDCCGTVFSITPSGKETVLHTFGGTPDGEFPKAPLVDLNGTLYGTTYQGGANNYGIVFSITPSGKETILYNFFGRGYGNSDGAYPLAGLANDNGTLYGTTELGGAPCSQNNSGCGTVYKIAVAGVESVLYSFTSLSNGVYPLAGLIDVNGALYGTTEHTIFRVTTSGKHIVLYEFTGTNGAYPEASLIDVGGVLYGTTANNGPGSTGNGTVFSLVP
jgi:uncharacterized repeat protein (TIGR03803 family)